MRALAHYLALSTTHGCCPSSRRPNHRAAGDTLLLLKQPAAAFNSWHG